MIESISSEANFLQANPSRLTFVSSFVFWVYKTAFVIDFNENNKEMQGMDPWKLLEGSLLYNRKSSHLFWVPKGIRSDLQLKNLLPVKRECASHIAGVPSVIGTLEIMFWRPVVSLKFNASELISNFRLCWRDVWLMFGWWEENRLTLYSASWALHAIVFLLTYFSL